MTQFVIGKELNTPKHIEAYLDNMFNNDAPNKVRKRRKL